MKGGGRKIIGWFRFFNGGGETNDFISLCHLNQGQLEATLPQRKRFENSHGTVTSGKGWQKLMWESHFILR